MLVLGVIAFVVMKPKAPPTRATVAAKPTPAPITPETSKPDALKLAGVSSSPPLADSSSSADILSFGGHRYQFIPGALSWTEAKAKAEAMGGHLATITSKEEDEWIKQTFGDKALQPNNNILLGGVASGGRWTWITGEPFTYTGWLPGLPDRMAEATPLQYWRRGKDELGWDDRNGGIGDTGGAVTGFIVEWDDAGSVSASPAYPQPSQWIDATAEVRDTGIKRGTVRVDGDWLEGIRTDYLPLAGGRSFTNAAVRVIFDRRIAIRHRHTDDGSAYIAEVGMSSYRLAAMIGQQTHSLKDWTGHEPGYSAQASHELVFTAQGDRLQFWLDGKLAASATDSRLPAGKLLITAYADKSTGAPRIKQVQYGELAPLAAAPAAATSAPGTATPATASKDAPFVNSLGMKFVPVPITGGPTDGQRVLFSVWETRVQDYEAFANETGREWPKRNFAQGPTHPAVNTHWDDATAFCAWLTTHEHAAGRLGANEVYRLPTDHEWSCAAGIGGREDPTLTPGQKNDKVPDAYPWEGGWPPPPRAGNYGGEELRPLTVASSDALPAGYRDDFPQTAPVGSFLANGLGIYDLGGNVSEWTADWQDPKPERKTLRGEGWTAFGRLNLLSSHRSADFLTPRSNRYGFRVVLAPAP